MSTNRIGSNVLIFLFFFFWSCRRHFSIFIYIFLTNSTQFQTSNGFPLSRCGFCRWLCLCHFKWKKKTILCNTRMQSNTELLFWLLSQWQMQFVKRKKVSIHKMNHFFLCHLKELSFRLKNNYFIVCSR